MFMKANFKKAKDITIEKIIGSYPTLSDSEEQIAPTKSIKNAFAAIFKPVENPEEILFGKKEIAE